MKAFLFTLLSFALLYLIILAAVFTYQRRLIFPAPDIYLTPSAVGVPEMTEVVLDTDVGELRAWWSPPRTSCQAAVMIFHGNGSAVFSNHDIFRDLIDAGYGVWSVAYPGYPGSTGEASETSLTEAGIIQFDIVQDTLGEGGKTHVYGTSIGAGVAAQLTRSRRPDTLFVDAPFYSAVELVKSNLWWMPIDYLMQDKFRSHEALRGVDIPLYWSHGTKDTIIPIHHGQRLYDEYQGPKRFVTIEGGDHVNLWGLGGRDFVLAALADHAGESGGSSFACPGSG